LYLRSFVGRGEFPFCGAIRNFYLRRAFINREVRIFGISLYQVKMPLFMVFPLHLVIVVTLGAAAFFNRSYKRVLLARGFLGLICCFARLHKKRKNQRRFFCLGGALKCLFC